MSDSSDAQQLNILRMHIAGLNVVAKKAAEHQASFVKGMGSELVHWNEALEKARNWTRGIKSVAAVAGLGPLILKLKAASKKNDRKEMMEALIGILNIGVSVACPNFGVLSYLLGCALGSDWPSKLIRPADQLLTEIDRHVGVGFNAMINPPANSTMSGVFFYPGTLKLRKLSGGTSSYDWGTATRRRPDPFIQIDVTGDHGWTFPKRTNVIYNIKESSTPGVGGASYYETKGFQPVRIYLGPGDGWINRVKVTVYEHDSLSRNDLLGEATYSGIFSGKSLLNQRFTDRDVSSFTMQFHMN